MQRPCLVGHGCLGHGMGSRQPAYRGRVAARNERWREPGADDHGAAMPIARHGTANSIDHSTETIHSNHKPAETPTY
jgi:hypothetical protein